MDVDEKEKMSPGRRLRVRFNQVSDDSPFITKGQEEDSEDEPFDKVGNILPKQRAEMGDGSYKPWTRSISGLHRVSDPNMVRENFRSLEAEERRRLDNSSPYRHMTSF